jgi:hypothetical protein
VISASRAAQGVADTKGSSIARRADIYEKTTESDRLAAAQGPLVQYAGPILRPYDGTATAEVHDYHDELTGVLASSLAERAPGYTSLGFPDPRKLPRTPAPTW